MDAIPTTLTSPRPYFLPPSIDFSALPQEVQLALREIVQPAYDELVLAAPTAVERSAGVSLTFLLALEVLDHFELGKLFGLAEQQSKEQIVQRETLIGRHLRVVGAKQVVSNFLMRLQSLRSRQDPFIAKHRLAGIR